VVGRDVTDQSGAYQVPANNPSGRFYAIATKKAGGATGGGKPEGAVHESEAIVGRDTG
jgi:hypothetical protein